ncbi:MAG: hypothetical protein BGO41_15815 [Clostridiales bacterium 38-18]|nr:MAG: hypothetical protein BGO41_15815 [Clostridiales bacterium 38-18]
MKNSFDVVIIGGGPAGIAAAIESKANGASTLIIERDAFLGGILNQCIHNGFGLTRYNEELTGPEYAEREINQLTRAEVTVYKNTMVVTIDAKEHRIKIVSKDYGVLWINYTSLVLAMGCRERARGSVILPGKRPAGVFTAGTAQFYINIMGQKIGNTVFVLGSGDIGLIMARRLSLEGCKVIGVAEIRSFSSGLNRNIAQCLEDYSIPLMLEHTVVEVHGDSRVTGVTVARVNERYEPIESTKAFYACDTLLLSVGLIPENELTVQAGIKLDAYTKGPVVNQELETEVDGVFACGNVTFVHDLVDYVSASGKRAGHAAALYALEAETRQREMAISVSLGSNIAMLMPQRIVKQNRSEAFEMMLRVSKRIEKGKIIVSNDREILYTAIRSYLSPGEAITLSVNYPNFNLPIKVNVIEL